LLTRRVSKIDQLIVNGYTVSIHADLETSMQDSGQKPDTKLPEELGLTIYDSLEKHQELFLSQSDLETTLREKLAGLKLDQPIRTRSKVVKTAICQALGYPVPKSFIKSQPRFPGQNFDVYTQKSDNLQIWNEELSAARRYVLVRVNEDDLDKVEWT
jgi:hypothetical protein